MNHSLDYAELDGYLKYLLELSVKYQKKPILDLKLKGSKVDPKILSGELSRLNDYFLYYTWNVFDKEQTSGYSYDFANDFNIDEEMSKLILNTMKSETLTGLSTDLIQMINSGEPRDNADINKNKSKEIVDYLWKYYENNKNRYQDKDEVNLK